MAPTLYLIVVVAALLTGGRQPAAPPLEARLFEQTRRSVFVVETESGHGSGFLVHEAGFILTNDHVLGRTRYLAVGVEPSRKYPAAVVARDSLRDLAVIRIHPAAVQGVRPLPFAGSGATVSVGERVLAIGSALSDDGSVLTSGFVSRTTENTIIADLNVNSGSSGGPLLNLAGQVVGICTFYQKAAAGPGLAGVVPTKLILPVLEGATLSASQEPPPFERLPVPSPIPYPVQSLYEKATALGNLSGYTHTVGQGRIHVLTPPAVFFEAHQKEILEARHTARSLGNQTAAPQPDRHGYSWQRHVGQIEAIVGIRVLPDGDSASDFERMQLLRDGVEVDPIVPGRFCPSASSARGESQVRHCFGLYQYSPEVFTPGAELEVRVYFQDAPTKARIWRLPSRLVKRVWSDFDDHPLSF